MSTKLQLEWGDDTCAALVSGNDVRLTPGDREFRVTPEAGRLSVSTAAGQHVGNAVVSGDDVWVTIAGEVFVFHVSPAGRRTRSGTHEQDAFTPPMAATVVRIAVAPGAHVHDGDVLIALEAMKMELPIRAPRDGVVTAIHCREGELVQPGQVLLDFE